MKNNATFTICAKNYLAQAYTLRESFLFNNPNYDFFIFLSDNIDDLPIELVINNNLIKLDVNWIQNWQSMAFKYNVIEFSTSIKPFCFKKLFTEKYEKVIYLDPDTYVTSSLDVIYNFLDDKSIILTPHYCNIQTKYTGSITEEEILFVGIYNLGVVAIKNNSIGLDIIEWWMNRLANKCYADKTDALHVDQKWIDFIPAFFPNDLLITHHFGINPAIWNLHERELVIHQNKFNVKNKKTNEIYPLIFFHFSGFDPYKPKLINRRHPNYNIDIYPSFIPLFQEYINGLILNEYDKYSKMSYSFNSFSNGENILPIQRRLFRIYEDNFLNENPFIENGPFFKTLKNNNLLSGVKSKSFSIITDSDRSKRGLLENFIIIFFKFIKFILGNKFYFPLIKILNTMTRLENQRFLIKKDL